MRILNELESTMINGALRFNNGVVIIAEKGNIPNHIYSLIETNLQNVIDGSCSQERFLSMMKEKGCLPYLETYFDNLYDEL